MTVFIADQTDARLLLLASDDSVLVVRDTIEKGEEVMVCGRLISLSVRIGMGHKLAAKSILMGDKIIKYGAPIGSATRDIEIGEHVHLHNLKSDYTPTYALPAQTDAWGAEI